MSRILPGSALVGGIALDLKRKYSVATKTYISEGKDGYEVFSQCPVLVPEEGGAVIPTAVRNHFRKLEILHLL
jgi:5'-nucleotidase